MAVSLRPGVTPSFALLAALGAAVGASACGGADASRATPSAGKAATTSRVPARPSVVVFRIPRAGGLVRAYAWERLDSAVWTSAVALPPAERVLGLATGPGLLVLTTPKGVVRWLDVRRNELLPAGPALDLAAAAVEGFVRRGEIVGVDSARQIVRATPAGAAWRVRPPTPVRALVPLPDGAIVGYGQTSAGASLWRWVPPDTALSGEVPAARDGILASGAAGGRIWLAAPGTVQGVATAPLAEALTLPGLPRGAARDLVTTPSGSTAFALHEGAAAIEVVDRYRGTRVPDWSLPGQPRALRMDPSGRTLLVQPATGESAWAVDVATGSLRSTLSTSWRHDLPTVAPDGAVLTVLGPDVTVLDAETLQRRRTITSGAADWWLVAVWDGLSSRGVPSSPTTWAGIDTAPTVPTDSVPASDSAATADTSSSASEPIPVAGRAPTAGAPSRGSEASGVATPTRWVVSFASLVSEEGAAQLAREIRATGAPARVLRADGARGAAFRVVLGPFATRDSAVRAGRTSGRQHWVLPAR